MRHLPTLAVDVVAIVVFAVLGRSSHAEQNTLLGVLGTAWPFLAAAAVGHGLTLLVPGLRGEPAGLRTGAVVWASAVVLGVTLRLLSGDTAAWSFVLVTAIVLAVFLLGWRGLHRLVERARRRDGATVS